MDENKKISLEIDKSAYEIRPATPEDLDQIYQIETISFRDAYPLSLLLQLIKDRNSTCLIMEIEEKIVGFAFGFIRHGKKGHIMSVAVHPHHRNNNFGSFLVAQLMSLLKEKGAIAFELEVRVSNKIAQKLYEKFNFKIKETKHRYYSDGEDAYLMVFYGKI